MLKNDYSGFPKVKWLHLAGEVDNSSCQIFLSIYLTKNYENRLIFDRVIQKTKKVDVFSGTLCRINKAVRGI